MGRFVDALRAPGLGAIAEIKRRSPSAGELRPDADPAVIAPAYAAAGAAAISVLVDERFGGTWDDLRSARAATTAPLLAKGFFSTEEHLQTAKEAGADAALLLLRDLDDTETAHLLAIAARLGLDTLVEAHDAGELDRGVALGAQVIGINARDLSTFAIDRRAQLELVARAPRDRVVIAESGVETRAQGALAELAGADAILVGSALMRAADPAAKLGELLSRPLVKVCGLTRQEDVDAAADAGADWPGSSSCPTAHGRHGCARCARRDALGRGLGRAVGESTAPTSTRCTRSKRARCAAARPCSCATASRLRACSTCRGREPIPSTGAARRGNAVLAGRRAGS